MHRVRGGVQTQSQRQCSGTELEVVFRHRIRVIVWAQLRGSVQAQSQRECSGTKLEVVF